MSDDLAARLDRAITEARTDVMIAQTDDRLDRYAALMAVRARLEEIGRLPCPASHNDVCGRQDELTAEAERLLETQ